MLKINSKYLFILYLIGLNSCNTSKLEVIADLPTSLKEVSAVEIIPNSDLLWVIEDGNNNDAVIGLDSKGTIKRQIILSNAKNKDWEDLTTDTKGNLYIGDFGNNDSKRKNLLIYKIPNPASFSKDTINAEKIYFNFPEQHKFPPKKEKRFYDVEAFFYANEQLYLFTKTKFGKTLLYKIPASEGNYNATLLDDVNLCDNADCAITSADISDDGKTVVLLNHQSIWVLSDYKNDSFLKGNRKQLLFNHNSQKEGVCFYDKNTLIITDERNKSEGGNIYRFKID